MAHDVTCPTLFYIDSAPRLRYILPCFLKPTILLHHGDREMIVLETILRIPVAATG